MDEVADLAESAESDGLFSLHATENAEVVPPSGRRGNDSLWTVAANQSTVVDDIDTGEPDPSRPTVPPPFGTAYRSPIGSSIRSDDSEHHDLSSGIGQEEELDSDDLWVETDPVDAVVAGSWQDSDDVTDFGSDPGAEPVEPQFSTGGQLGGSPFSDIPFTNSYSEGVYSEQQAGSFQEPTYSGVYADTSYSRAYADPEAESWVHDHQPDPEPEPAASGFAEEDEQFWSDSTDATTDESGVYDSVGSVFRAEPVERNDEVIDHPDDQVDLDPVISDRAKSLFSNGGGAGATPAFGSPGWSSSPSDPNLWQAGNQTSEVADRPDSAASGADEDSPGFISAIGRLSVQDRDRAAIPLLVAGALLGSGEEVLGLLVGQMLGRPSVMVLTSKRILVVNDRRWQPVVDVYLLDRDLEVRGRHDRNVAAIGLSDSNGLSMVDGIFDVQSAMNMVARIRTIIEDGS
ncbi:MAG: hypothetical protein KDB26_05045 [Microthrixaceae bacterium]|nr:hypothetical protein [Microthrixaceae bacterium]